MNSMCIIHKYEFLKDTKPLASKITFAIQKWEEEIPTIVLEIEPNTIRQPNAFIPTITLYSQEPVVKVKLKSSLKNINSFSLSFFKRTNRGTYN